MERPEEEGIGIDGFLRIKPQTKKKTRLRMCGCVPSAAGCRTGHPLAYGWWQNRVFVGGSPGVVPWGAL